VSGPGAPDWTRAPDWIRGLDWIRAPRRFCPPGRGRAPGWAMAHHRPPAGRDGTSTARREAVPGAVPLPAGFGVAFDSGTRFVGPDVLFGGSPRRLLRLTAAGARALDDLRHRPVGSPQEGRLARRLTDAGLAHPRPPAGRQPADATVVLPVRDRAAGLDRCLAALGDRYPVIVVDDGSRDPAAVARVCARHGARLRRRPSSGGAGQARNDGLALVTTSLVAFIDSDCAADPG
jgi:mycofactocin glycosyltransferase